MARDSEVSKAIYRRHIRLFRYLNDAWIFTELLRPELLTKAKALRATNNIEKKNYPVPKEERNGKDNAIGTVNSKRRDEEIGGLFYSQHNRGIFETNIISMVSRTEAFIQDCIAIVVTAFPKKLGILADKNGIPLDVFLDHDDRKDVISRFVALRCEGLMFAKPSEYMEKLAKVLAIPLDEELVLEFIEIKASRDLIIHNNGRINKLYMDKVGSKARGKVGDELSVDHDYFRHVITKLKRLSGSIQRETENAYK